MMPQFRTQPSKMSVHGRLSYVVCCITRFPSCSESLISPSLPPSLILGLNDGTLVAVSDLVYFKNYNYPLQGHLSLTNDTTQMVYAVS